MLLNFLCGEQSKQTIQNMQSELTLFVLLIESLRKDCVHLEYLSKETNKQHMTESLS